MRWSIDGLDGLSRNTSAVTDAASWLRACAATEAGRAVVLRQGEHFLPLCWQRRHGLSVVEALGQGQRTVAGPVGVAKAPMPVLGLADLPARADLLDFRRFPAVHADSVFPGFPSRLASVDIACFKRSLAGDEEAFLASLSKGARKDLRYAMRRVERTFGKDSPGHEAVTLGAENRDAAWNRAADLAGRSWQGKAGVSVVTDGKKKRFLKRLMENGMTVKIHFYSLGDVLAAFAITMENGKEILIYAHEYDAAYAKYQPGHILNFSIIATALTNGISLLDFGVGETPHKYEWQCSRETLWRILVPLTWKGHLALAYQKARWFWGGLRNRPKGR